MHTVQIEKFVSTRKKGVMRLVAMIAANSAGYPACEVYQFEMVLKLAQNTNELDFLTGNICMYRKFRV